MCLTSPTPSAARPTTNRTGGPSPSPSSLCSKGPTTLVTMVTVMTTWSFHRILMGSSGSRCTKRYLAKWQQKDNYKKKKQNRRLATVFWLPFYSSSFMINRYNVRKKKMDRPQNWLDMIGWKAFFGWRSECNLTPSVTLGHVYPKITLNGFIVMLQVLLKSSANIYTVDIYTLKSISH